MIENMESAHNVVIPSSSGLLIEQYEFTGETKTLCRNPFFIRSAHRTFKTVDETGKEVS